MSGKLHRILSDVSAPIRAITIRFGRSADGATTVEYCMLASLAALAAILAMRAVGANVVTMYDSIRAAVFYKP